MFIDVYLRDTQTGKEGIYHCDYEYKDTKDQLAIDHILWMWAEGNYSCDCNRALFLYGDCTESDIECSDGRISIDKITIRETGDVLFTDL